MASTSPGTMRRRAIARSRTVWGRSVARLRPTSAAWTSSILTVRGRLCQLSLRPCVLLTSASWISSRHHGRGREAWSQGLEKEKGQETRRGLYGALYPSTGFWDVHSPRLTHSPSTSAQAQAYKYQRGPEGHHRRSSGHAESVDALKALDPHQRLFSPPDLFI